MTKMQTTQTTSDLAESAMNQRWTYTINTSDKWTKEEISDAMTSARVHARVMGSVSCSWTLDNSRTDGRVMTVTAFREQK